MSYKGNKWLYDSEQLAYIRQLFLSGSRNKALIYIEEYIKKYPNDGHGLSFYITVLLYFKKYDEAEFYIEKLADMDDKAVLYKIYTLYFLKGEYSKAYSLYSRVKEEKFHFETDDSSNDFKIDLTFLKAKLGLDFTDEEKENFSYLEKQFVEYDEKRTLEHIKHNNTDKNMKYNPKHIFESEINIKDLFNIVKESLPNATPEPFTWTNDVYYFQYPLVKNFNDYSNPQFKYLRVVTTRDTYNIITMYPYPVKNRINNVNILCRELNQIDDKNYKHHI